MPGESGVSLQVTEEGRLRKGSRSLHLGQLGAVAKPQSVLCILHGSS